MNTQVIFVTVATHLFTQGVQSKGNNGMCTYLDLKTGHSCAVGCLLSERVAMRADLDPDGVGTSVLDIKKRGFLPKWLEPYVDLLNSLQAIHDLDDNWQDTQAMQASLTRAGNRHGLDTEFLNTLSFADR